MRPCCDLVMLPLLPLLPLLPPSCCQHQAGRQRTSGLCRHRDNYNATFCRCLCSLPSCRQRQACRRRTPGLRRCRSTMPPSRPDEGSRVHSHGRSPKSLARSSVTAPSPPSDSICHSPGSVGAPSCQSFLSDSRVMDRLRG